MKKVRLWRAIVGMALAVFGLGVVGAVAEPMMSAAFAEEAEQKSVMAVSPMWQTIILTPGESTTKSIRVQNPATAKQNLKYSVSVGSYSQVPVDESNVKAGTTTDIETVTDQNQMMEWITLNKTSGELEPNQADEVSFTINVPSDAPGGGQYASIIIKDESDKSENGGDVMIQSDTQTASVIYAEVTGDTRVEGKVLENSVPSFLTSSPLTATSLIENDGNVHSTAKYTLQVWPLGSDEEICTNEEEASNRIVMPGTKMYHTESCDVGMVGIYKAKQTIEVFGQTSEVERTVFVCPIWLIVIVAVAILVLIWLIVRMVRRRN